jgi:5'-deoxynucleotidase YfbR-like HD superfamily hydrolase
MFTDQEVLEEVKKIQYLYALKQEIRYAETRGDTTESVAEHIYGMHICAQYFLPLENPEGTWDKARIYEMITLHDIDEIETGDVIGYLKTESMLANEGNAARRVMEKSPLHMQAEMDKSIGEYEQQETIESRFVKAIDKIESCIHMHNDEGKKMLLLNGTTLAQHKSIKDTHTLLFPHIYRFNKAITTSMDARGFFTKEA